MRVTLVQVALKDYYARKRLAALSCSKLHCRTFACEIERVQDMATFWHLMHIIMKARHLSEINVGDGIDKETRYASR